MGSHARLNREPLWREAVARVVDRSVLLVGGGPVRASVASPSHTTQSRSSFNREPFDERAYRLVLDDIASPRQSRAPHAKGLPLHRQSRARHAKRASPSTSIARLCLTNGSLDLSDRDTNTMVEAPEIESVDTSAPNVVDRREKDAEGATKDDAKRREVSACQRRATRLRQHLRSRSTERWRRAVSTWWRCSPRSSKRAGWRERAT